MEAELQILVTSYEKRELRFQSFSKQYVVNEFLLKLYFILLTFSFILQSKKKFFLLVFTKKVNSVVREIREPLLIEWEWSQPRAELGESVS